MQQNKEILEKMSTEQMRKCLFQLMVDADEADASKERYGELVVETLHYYGVITR